MKILIAYYSRSGNTKNIAQKLAKDLNADLDEIQDLKNRKGIKGYITGAFSALFNKTTKIQTKKDPTNYDLIILGTPIWGKKMVPAIRTYITTNKFKKTAFFCTKSGSKTKTYLDIEPKPISILEIKDKELETSKEKIKEFCKEVSLNA